MASCYTGEFVLYTISFGGKWTVCEAKGLSKPATKHRLSEVWTRIAL